MNKPTLPPAPPRSWSTPLLVLALVALVVASFATLRLDLAAFFTPEAVGTTLEFLEGFAPPEMATPFLLKTLNAALETLSMSALGTLLAVIAGLVLALPAAGRWGMPARAGVRMLLNVLRSIPELVWAALLLVAAGLGPFAGTLALAAHTSGVLGRLFADALENAEPAPEAALRTNGAPALSAFFYATLPQTLPQMLSYTLYRWENNIRAAAVLGVVGAGGLGQMLKYHLSLFQMQSAATVVLAMLLLVALVDAISFALRRALTR
ncbi:MULTISPECIES: phosphonate ABC transporter, permease protein PhnE [unclassified Massilia]|uniref:phosphonate ABC transporter, permease protein PhnE n=1 Tax=unclassified Massilia TaxID=2609279 RepID=UPI00178418B9|nr:MULTISPECIES: phosphonate ABC transporter, permease protein PhnE [unclassified Massilia]MBD8532113.1 phosphonate ABC transporter, permease protein PhnE [Massilia sp. CFBP 13647]MBD8675629.1 phosphonate ABC transporter, permease protein PhnE [Massilia sp. CFBP 13721]